MAERAAARLVAACHAQLGNPAAASLHVARARQQVPTLRVTVDCVPALHYKREEDLAHHRDALLKAGFAD